MATNVSTFQELKTAVEDATTVDILVTANITFSGGIKVNTNKSDIVIDFNNFQVTDNNNLNFTDTLYIESTTKSVKVTVKNAVFIGRNYYGVVGVYDGNTNCEIELINITYTGPQFVYNKNGITTINNCNVTLDKNGSSTSAQEFCEANRVSFLGNVVVNSNATSNAVIWFTGTNASFTVEENATLTINALSTYLLYTDVSPTMLFKKNSKTVITTKGGLFYNTSSSSHIANSFSLQENASFIAYKTASSSVPMFKCNSDFIINENSIFRLISEVSSTTALMYFGKTANIQMLNPKNVVLYNNGGNIFSFQTGSTSAPNVMQINAMMLRLWDTATTPFSSSGGFSDTPTTEYYKTDHAENVSLIINMTNSALSSVDNNLVSGDTGYPIAVSTFKILTSKVISLGSVTLSVDEITDISKAVTGVTNENANVKASYLTTEVTGTANSTGDFSIDLNESLPINIVVTVYANDNFLTRSIQLETKGSVSITSVKELDFYAFPNNSNLDIVYRQDSDWSVVVTDTREQGVGWELFAYITNPLSSDDSSLNNALIFRDDVNDNIVTGEPLLIYSGKWDKENRVTTLKWDKEKGFLLKIDSSILYKKGKYSTNILWKIETN